VFYFKPFKTTFRKVRDVVMSRNNHMELDKIILARWVDRTIYQSLIKKNIKVGFKVVGIWPFNPKVMDNKTQPSKIYTTTSIDNHGNDQEEYTSNEQTNHNQNQQWREEFVVAKLFHIAETSIHQTTFESHPTNRLEFDQCYYVDMLQSLTVIEEQLEEIVNLDEVILELVQKTQNPPNLT